MNQLIEKLSAIKAQQRWGLILGVAVGIFVAFYMLSYKKSQLQLTDIKSRVEQNKVNVERLQAIEKRLPRFERDLENLRKRLEISMSLLPAKREIPELLTQISRLGSESGLEFINFQPGPEKRERFYAEVPVVISVQGGYHDLALFMDGIRTLRRIVHVRNLQIGGMRMEGGVITLASSSTLVTYRFFSTEEEKEAQEAKEKEKKPKARGKAAEE